MRQDSHRNPAWFAVCAALASVALIAPQAAHAADAESGEGQQMEFTITIGGAPTGMSVRYKYRTSDDTAEKGKDYTAETGYVTFPAGSTEQKIHVDTLDDDEVEGSEEFKLELYDVRYQAAYFNMSGWIELQQNFQGVPQTMTLTGEIEDDD